MYKSYGPKAKPVKRKPVKKIKKGTKKWRV